MVVGGVYQSGAPWDRIPILTHGAADWYRVFHSAIVYYDSHAIGTRVSINRAS